jgi:hypothetical protein
MGQCLLKRGREAWNSSHVEPTDTCSLQRKEGHMASQLQAAKAHRIIAGIYSVLGAVFVFCLFALKNGGVSTHGITEHDVSFGPRPAD